MLRRKTISIIPAGRLENNRPGKKVTVQQAF
jgi:hypothetical protein